MRVELSAYVVSDLDDIASFIAADNAARAVTFIDEIEAKFQLIGENPRAYQVRREIGQDARLAVHGSYVILFRLDFGQFRPSPRADLASDRGARAKLGPGRARTTS